MIMVWFITWHCDDDTTQTGNSVVYFIFQLWFHTSKSNLMTEYQHNQKIWMTIVDR